MMMSSWNTNGGVEGKGTKFATTTSTDPDEEEKNQPQRRVGAGLRRNSCVGHHSLQSTLIVQSTISVTHQRRPDLLRRGMGRRRRGEEEEGEDAGEEDGYMVRHSDLCRAVCGRTSKRSFGSFQQNRSFCIKLN